MRAYGLSDIGKLRPINEDSFYLPREGERFCAVADGMGGHTAGEVASAMAIDVFSQELRACDKLGSSALHRAVERANGAVYEKSRSMEKLSGMGTTLVAALVRGKQVSVVNVGDSRAYLINQRGIRQITRDHSVVQMMVERGELTAEMAKSYPGKNLITRAVGTEMTVLCDIFRQEATKGDFLLLCSDGLSNLLDDQEVLFEVVHGVNKGRCCQRLLDIAISRGSPDNVTAVLISL